MRHAEKTYKKNTGEEVKHWQRSQLAKFTRNLAMIEGRLTAGVFDMSVAARGIVDDNYRMGSVGIGEPLSGAACGVRSGNAESFGEEVYFNTKRMRLRRRLPRFKQRLRPSALKKRKKEKYPGEWAKQIDGNSICSYPPEDLVIENYGRFLKQKAKSILSEERERVEPFTTSLLDGIDIRETIRNWHERKIYVRHRERINGDVGSVVVIFDDSHDDKYDYLTTWLGEHQNESDMAFYSTFPFDHLVGPGIGRAEYGGFLMTLAAAPDVRRVVRSGLRFGGDKGRAAVVGRPRLFGREDRRVRGAEAAAQHLSQHRGPDGAQDPVRSARSALAD